MKELAHGKLLDAYIIDILNTRLEFLIGVDSGVSTLSIPTEMISPIILVEEDVNLLSMRIGLENGLIVGGVTYPNRLIIATDSDSALTLMPVHEAVDFLQRILDNKKER